MKSYVVLNYKCRHFVQPLVYVLLYMNVFTVGLNDMLVPGASYSLHKIMI